MPHPLREPSLESETNKHMKALITKSFQSKIEAFTEALTGARSNLLRAGQLLVEMLEENEDTFELLVTQKVASLPMLESLERVGRGQLDPLLLTDTSPAAQRAISQAIPPKDQKRLLTGLIPVAIQDNGGIRIEQRRMDELNTWQAAQAIGDGKIRTAEEQIDVVRERIEARAARSLRYEIRGDRVIFHEESSYTWKELEEIAAKIKPQARDIEAEIKRKQIEK